MHSDYTGLQGNFISLEKWQLKDIGCNHLQNTVSIIQKTAAGVCEVLKVLPCRRVPSQCSFLPGRQFGRVL